MPGYELVNFKERKEINDIFTKSNGVMFAHGFEKLRNNIYRVRDFEKKIQKKLKVKYCLACTSGTMAQYIAMKALDIGSGDEVITQGFTFVATAEAIIALGAKPIFCNIDETLNMCPIDLKKKITKKTKLVIPVPMLGGQVNINQIKKVIKGKKIRLLEDACESLGAKQNGKFVGTQSDIGIYSLDFAKTITTGEGGLIVTNSKKYYMFCKEFHDHGHKNDPKIPRGLEKARLAGLNLRMSEMQAAFGLAQLKKLDEIVKKNRKNKTFLKKKIIKKNFFDFRKIIETKNELADTLIIICKKKTVAKKFYKHLLSNNCPIKILPNALYWHFAGNWTHILNKKQIRELNYSSNLLERCIALPIMVKSKKKELIKYSKIINEFKI